ncbi:serpentine type 7TM GPCR chemoreceptor srsx domain-containing protein [Ditylenchus destructor]|uniref:Serpentine type 7TM GPCR chemoreceptor srsx domain-containing protein n=1 Tax=Ditylenchus destructor TaxID=166010 RepID=A0AAD4MVB1_9BILA|nr:serpentine type 7TM GPCR chemoreceptor srsx domain-containing protein [Ditylenchus destructor]
MDSSDTAFVLPDCQLTYLHVYEGIKATIGIVGALLNFVLTYIVIRHKHLHSPCNFLIASSSFCIAHWQMNWMVAFIFVELDADVISKSFCIGMQAYLVSCVQGMNILILCIALDRLLNVAFPTWARSFQKLSYFLAILTIVMVYVGIQTYDSVNAANELLKGVKQQNQQANLQSSGNNYVGGDSWLGQQLSYLERCAYAQARPAGGILPKPVYVVRFAAVNGFDLNCFIGNKQLSRMDTIHRHVIFEVLKFIPFENARNLLTTQKSWLAPLMAQLEKQRKAITAEMERLEESYRPLTITQLNCKERYVDIENQMKTAAYNFYNQIYNHKFIIAPCLRHTQNVQSLNQHLQDLQNLRPAFDAASLELSNITAKVQALHHKISGMKETLGIKKRAKERVLEQLGG